VAGALPQGVGQGSGVMPAIEGRSGRAWLRVVATGSRGLPTGNGYGWPNFIMPRVGQGVIGVTLG
jgi:hypothetical protein